MAAARLQLVLFDFRVHSSALVVSNCQMIG